MAELSQLRPVGSSERTRDAAPRNTVRVTRANHRGFVEFQFAMGDPELYLEMTLPPAAFAEFCARHAVVQLSAAQGAAVDRATRRWSSEFENDDDARVD